MTRKTRTTALEWLPSLPSSWDEREIGRDVWVRARLGWKGLTAGEYVDDGIPMLATPDIKDAEIRYAQANKITEDRYAESPEIMLQNGDVLLTKDGSTIGTVNVVRDLPERATVNGSIAVLTPTRELNGRYLYWFIASGYAQSIFGRLRGGMGVPHLFQRDINRIRMPHPPTEEQQAIADYLDRETSRIDTLIEEQKSLIETLRERRQAVVDESLQPDTDWEVHALKFALEGIDQGVSPQAESDLAQEPGSWGVLKSGCVNRGVFNPLEHKRLPVDFAVSERLVVSMGDLLVSRASGSPDLVGSAGIVDRLGYNLILSDKLFRLRLRDGHEPRFFYWLLNSRHYRTQVRQSISGAEGLANNLPLSALRNFSVAVAPAADQRRIAASLDEQTTKIDQLIAETERFIELSKERRAALITAAVTGQIDIRDEVA